MENLSATVRVVQKHLRYAIEDVGVLEYGVGEKYYTANPGYGYTLSDHERREVRPDLSRNAQSQARILGRQLQPGQEVRQQLAGRIFLHLEPADGELLRTGQLR